MLKPVEARALNPDEQHRSDAKRAAALSSVAAALAVTLLKLLTGLLTGSLGMLSEPRTPASILSPQPSLCFPFAFQTAPPMKSITTDTARLKAFPRVLRSC